MDPQERIFNEVWLAPLSGLDAIMGLDVSVDCRQSASRLTRSENCTSLLEHGSRYRSNLSIVSHYFLPCFSPGTPMVSTGGGGKGIFVAQRFSFCNKSLVGMLVRQGSTSCIGSMYGVTTLLRQSGASFPTRRPAPIGRLADSRQQHVPSCRGWNNYPPSYAEMSESKVVRCHVTHRDSSTVLINMQLDLTEKPLR